MVASSGFDGLEMIAADFMVRAISVPQQIWPAAEDGMQKKFTVAFGAQDRGLDGIDLRAAKLFHRRRYLADRRLLRLDIANDAALAHVLASDFKLRLHQSDQIEVRRTRSAHALDNRRQNQRRRNERHIHRDQLDRFAWRIAGPKLRGREIARVGFFQQPHARVRAQLHVHLPIAGIDGDDLACAVLQQAIRKAPGRSAHIQADASADIDLPMRKRCRQLQSAATDVGKVVAQYANRSVARDRRSCLVDLLFIDQHAPRKNQRLPAFPRRHQPPLHEQTVESQLHRASVP